LALIAEYDSSYDHTRKFVNTKVVAFLVLFLEYLELSNLDFCNECYDQNTKRYPIWIWFLFCSGFVD